MARVLADLGANCEREWTYENDAGRWPKNAKNERVKRKYKLFNLKGEDGTSARFLVTWIASGGVGIPAPSERFKDIENEIRTNIANNSFGVGVAGCGKNQEGSGKTRKKPLKGCEVNPENAAFWGAFKKWCRDNGREWCTANVATRGNPYYEPEGRRQPLHLFFTIKKQGKLLVTIGIYCHRGEQQRQAIRGYKNEFRGISATQDWESGSGKAKRICFIRMVDWQNPSPELFRQMADDYEAVRGVLRRHGEL